MVSLSPRISQIVIVTGRIEARNGGGIEGIKFEEETEQRMIYQKSTWYFDHHNQSDETI